MQWLVINFVKTSIHCQWKEIRETNLGEITKLGGLGVIFKRLICIRRLPRSCWLLLSMAGLKKHHMNIWTLWRSW